MPPILLVHGVGHQFSGPNSIAALWRPALLDGLRGVCDTVGANDIECAFYGDLFRPAGAKSPVPFYSADDVQPGLETELLFAWWDAAAAKEGLPGSDDPSKARAPSLVRLAVRVLTGSRFFTGISERFLIGDLKQVARYFQEPSTRKAARAAVASLVTPETRVVVAHSLGTVIAYEALFEATAPLTFVTLGSPLGMRTLIFDRLVPPGGHWPPAVVRWTNIADAGDVVASVPRLGALFGGELLDLTIDNGARAHDASRYLTARVTGEAIAAGL